MAGSVNKAIIIGNVGQDPDIRTAQSGDKIANFSIATSESWKDKNTGEKKERTEWHRVVVFNQSLIPVIEQYVKKGNKLYIEGAIQTRKWTDSSDIDRYTTEIVIKPYNGSLTMLTSKGSGGPPPATDPADYGQSSFAQNQSDAQTQAPPMNDGLEDEIPY